MNKTKIAAMEPSDPNTDSLNHRVPVQARSKQKRSEILHQARIIFAERGCDAANVRDIAAAAKTTHSMIRYHFGTKDQLWRESVRDMFELLDEALALDDQSSATLSGLEGFKAYLQRYIRYSAAHPEHARIMIMESVRGGDRLDWIVETFIRPLHENLSERFETSGGIQGMPDMHPISFVYILTAACQMPFVLAQEAKALYGINTLEDEMVETHIESVMNLFFQDRAIS
ncbi:TetR/AcrR family transcriptional regulator [Parasphingorhabdus cellanae]|uniref:TetR/AcrR family transcriptional regulator n=1 Tax=Parasphingorhabdus cellanae TaxID=2806553 RepID=A0ABX7T9T8_9SPHN|nr:TetR/AcrR family transcriptional regulator [Parasphingorhabdus cellanae]QTD57087.1 TetR/AcrR family transcriptional regulator [Parasphingorhabdus cellanae]